jgi:hypothetical protein
MHSQNVETPRAGLESPERASLEAGVTFMFRMASNNGWLAYPDITGML